MAQLELVFIHSPPKGEERNDDYSARIKSTSIINNLSKEDYKDPPTSLSQRIIANDAVLALLKKPEPLSYSDLATLSQYTGWGGLVSYFNNENNYLKQAYPKDYENVRASLTSSYYTPQDVIDAIIETISDIEIDGGRVLEPSAGIGSFIRPLSAYFSNLKVTAIKPDPISYKILTSLYDLEGHQAKLEDTQLKNKYDLIIGNPPYGITRVHDAHRSNISGLNLHNYFLEHAVELLTDKGIMTMVVPDTFLDSKSLDTKERLIKQGSFLGALRLPNNTFSQTSVVTDILYYQKGVFSDDQAQYLRFGEKFNLEINHYYINNPENILGSLKPSTAVFGSEILTVTSENIKISDAIIERASEFVVTAAPVESPSSTEDDKAITLNAYELKDTNITDLPNGYLFEYDNEIYRKDDGTRGASDEYISADLIKTTQPLKELYISYINLRDEYYTLLRLEKAPVAEPNGVDQILEDARARTKHIYTEFVKIHGYINNKDNREYLSLDAGYFEVCGLEVLTDEGTGHNKKTVVTPSDILLHRTVHNVNITTYDTPLEALSASLNKHGYANIGHISEICSVKDHSEIIEALSDKVIFDPINEVYQLRSLFLSGDLGAKIDKIKHELMYNNASEDKEYAARYDQLCEEALKALNDSLPERVSWTEINVSFGVTWLDPVVYKEFIKTYGQAKIDIEYSESGKLKINKFNIYGSGKNEFTAPDVSPNAMFKHCFNNTALLLNTRV